MNRINQPIKIFCPICGTALERPEKETHTRNPSPGDVSICQQCGELSEFDSTLNLVKITDEEKLKEMFSQLQKDEAGMVIALKKGEQD